MAKGQRAGTSGYAQDLYSRPAKEQKKGGAHPRIIFITPAQIRFKEQAGRRRLAPYSRSRREVRHRWWCNGWLRGSKAAELLSTFTSSHSITWRSGPLTPHPTIICLAYWLYCAEDLSHWPVSNSKSGCDLGNQITSIEDKTPPQRGIYHCVNKRSCSTLYVRVYFG